MGIGFPYLYDGFYFDDYTKNPDLRKYTVLKHQSYKAEDPEATYDRFEVMKVIPKVALDVSSYDTEPTFR